MTETLGGDTDMNHGTNSGNGHLSARQFRRPSSSVEQNSCPRGQALCSEGQTSSTDVHSSCQDAQAASNIGQTPSFDTGSPSSLAKSSYTEDRSSWWEHMLYKLRHLLSRLLGMEFVRFAIVGGIATAIHYGIYLLLKLIISVNLAYTAGYLISLACNFFLTAKVTFRTGVSPLRGAGFAASHAVNYLLHMLLLNLFIRLGVPSSLAPVPVYCIAIPVNFILVRTVFRRLR